MPHYNQAINPAGQSFATFLRSHAASVQRSWGACNRQRYHLSPEEHDMETDDITRRDFVTMTVAAGIAVTGAKLTAQQVVETNVDIKTADGTCDAAFLHPAGGLHAGVVIWTDAFGLRPSMREIASRLAGEGDWVRVP